MGVTKSEGTRIFMYEAFMVVISASILGTIVGFITAVTIASQFYMFIELPVEISFPYYLLGGMLVISFITTWFAVWVPVTAVNNKKIASVLKAGS